MVTEEQLEALDLLLWLGSGKLVGARQRCNQSSVSRRIANCLEILGLSLKRQDGQYLLSETKDYLLLERQVHQLLRLRDGERLRLEATHCISHLLQPSPPGWLLGSFDHRSVGRMFELLRQRVIDAWVTSDSFDLPAADDPDLAVIQLSRWPARVLADAHHPLGQESGLSNGDLDRFPVLAFPETIYPVMAAALDAIGFGASHTRLACYDSGSWNSRTADEVTLSFGGSVSAHGSPGQVMLQWNLGLVSGETLVLRRDLVGHPQLEKLVEQLRQRFLRLQPHCPDVTLLV
ncbi:MAG: LysR family transcriptional regulator [Cyanobium sp.]